MKREAYHLTQAECDRLRRLRAVPHTQETCAELMGRSVEAIRRCIARGFKPYVSEKRRPRPSDFALLADTMTTDELAAHYRTGLVAVQRWSAEIGRKRLRRYRPRAFPCPVDLAERIAELGPTGALAHYDVCEGVMQRWREEAGLPVRHRRATSAHRKQAAEIGGVGWVDRYSAGQRGQPVSSKENVNV